VDDALGLDAFLAAAASGLGEQHLHPADTVLMDWPRVSLSAAAANRLRQGQPVPLEAEARSATPVSEYARAYDAQGEFMAVLRADPAAGVWRPHKVFSEP
jgi:tRNA U55 pseudouridine synthase TruB